MNQQPDPKKYRYSPNAVITCPACRQVTSVHHPAAVSLSKAAAAASTLVRAQQELDSALRLLQDVNYVSRNTWKALQSNSIDSVLTELRYTLEHVSEERQAIINHYLENKNTGAQE